MRETAVPADLLSETWTASSGEISVDLVEAGGLRSLGGYEWGRLQREAAEPNPFHSRSYLLSGLATIDRDKRVRALVFRDPAGALSGIVPFHRGRLGPVPVNWVCANLYQFSAAPLLRGSDLDPLLHGFLEKIAACGPLTRPWLFRNVRMDGPFVAALSSVAAEAGWLFRPVRTYQRPMLERSHADFETHARATLTRKRAKEIRRIQKRLEELGTLRFERVRDTACVPELIEVFLALEHAGWKGAAGTSFRSDPEHERFLVEALKPDSDSAVEIVIDVLTLNGRPIAILINLVVGRLTVTPKIAIDETFRKFGPGVLLEYFATRAFYQEGLWDRVDSAAMTEKSIVEDLWSVHYPIADMLLARNDFAGRAALSVLRTRRWAIDFLRSHF